MQMMLLIANAKESNLPHYFKLLKEKKEERDDKMVDLTKSIKDFVIVQNTNEKPNNRSNNGGPNNTRRKRK
jgi:hypothetical protein